MRVNNAQSIRTANVVHARFGSWHAAKEQASFRDGKFVVRALPLAPAADRREDRATTAHP